MSANNETTQEINPYTAARQEWNERYGDHIRQAMQWKAFAFAALAMAALSVFGVLYQSGKSKLVPYVVELDRLGNTLATRRADEAQPADSRVIRAALASFVRNARTITADGYVQKAMLNDAYAYLSNSDPATAALNEYFSKNSPFERAQTETVTVEINQALPMTKETWQIEWTETAHTRKGPVKDVVRWKANATIYLAAPTSEAAILKNPLGIFFKEFSWAKQL